MAVAAHIGAGTVLALWRYPVKSMLGEELDAVAVREGGLVGDRAFALVDRSDGKVATAKNPRTWPGLFAFRAALVESAGAGGRTRALRITLPDGRVVSGEQHDVDAVLSAAVGRPVTLTAAAPGAAAGVRASIAAGWQGTSEQYRPEMEGPDAVVEFQLPAETFFDCATVHLVTTGTLERLGALYPHGRFDARRFRPNIVVRAAGEGEWIGRTLEIGGDLRLRVTKPSGRCVMTTLPQSDLPRDPLILRTVAQHNGGNVGVYATVLRGGTIKRGDAVTVRQGSASCGP